MPAVMLIAATATADVATPISTSTINRRQRRNRGLSPLFIDGRFSSRDRTVTLNVGHWCRFSYQRYSDLRVGRHPASTGVLSARQQVLQAANPRLGRRCRPADPAGRSMSNFSDSGAEPLTTGMMHQ